MELENEEPAAGGSMAKTARSKSPNPLSRLGLKRRKIAHLDKVISTLEEMLKEQKKIGQALRDYMAKG